MRIAALYDIHGNLPALEAVLADVARAAVDRIVIGGDVLPGPMPRDTMARLASLDVPTAFLPTLLPVAQAAGLCRPYPRTDPVHFELCAGAGP